MFRSGWFYAARNGYYNIIWLMIVFNKNIFDIQDNVGNTALSLAILNGHIDIVNLLLDLGSNIDSINVLWSFHDSCLNNHIKVVMRLLECNILDNLQDEFLLYQILCRNNLTMSKLLVANGLCPEIKESYLLSREACILHHQMMYLDSVSTSWDQLFEEDPLIWMQISKNRHPKAYKYFQDRLLDILPVSRDVLSIII